MNLRCILALILLIFLSTSVSAQVLACQKSITKSVRLDHNWVCPFGGPGLDAVNIVLDCQGHSISGPSSEIGVTVSADRAKVVSCNITGFRVGIIMKGLSGADVADSVLQNNGIGISAERVRDLRVTGSSFVSNSKVGIYSKASYLTSVQNAFAENGKDIQEIDPLVPPPAPEPARVAPPSEVLPPAPSYPEPASPDLPRVTVFANQVSESSINDLGIDMKSHTEAASNIEIRKAFRQEINSLVFSVILTATSDIENLVVYEEIPKEIANSLSDVSSPNLHEASSSDHALRFLIGPLSPGSEAEFEYRINNPVIPINIGAVSMPSSIVVSEKRAAWQPPWWIEAVFALYLMILGVWLFESIVSPAKGMGIGLCIAVIAILLFISFDMDFFIIVSRRLNQNLVLIALIAASCYFAFKGWRLSHNPLVKK